MHELDDEELFRQVVTSLERRFSVTGIQTVGIGNEFYVLRAEMPVGPVAIKVPKDRVFSNVNDAYIDARVLLDQELAIMEHLRDAGIKQTPELMDDAEIIEAAGFPALVMSYVPSDDSWPDDYKLGELLASVHLITPPKIALSAQEGSEIPDLIAKRLHRRWNELNSFVEALPALPSRETLIQTLEPVREVKQLLHMDFRKANFRMKNGEVIALFDWSNALIGHPALELARVIETGEAGDNFLLGYTSKINLPKVAPDIETVFRLDAATMLALVFLAEEPDPGRASVAVERVLELLKMYKKLLKS